MSIVFRPFAYDVWQFCVAGLVFFWPSSTLFSVVAYSSARDILFPERHQESELAAKWGHMKWGMAVWKVRHPEISVGPRNCAMPAPVAGVDGCWACSSWGSWGTWDHKIEKWWCFDGKNPWWKPSTPIFWKPVDATQETPPGRQDAK